MRGSRTELPVTLLISVPRTIFNSTVVHYPKHIALASSSSTPPPNLWPDSGLICRGWGTTLYGWLSHLIAHRGFAFGQNRSPKWACNTSALILLVASTRYDTRIWSGAAGELSLSPAVSALAALRVSSPSKSTPEVLLHLENEFHVSFMLVTSISVQHRQRVRYQIGGFVALT